MRHLTAVSNFARARKSFLWSFATAYDEQHTIHEDGKNHGIACRHDRRRIDHDKFVFVAQLGDRLGPCDAKRAGPQDSADRTGRNRGEIIDAGMRNRDVIQMSKRRRDTNSVPNICCPSNRMRE